MIFSGFYVDFLNHIIVNVINTLVLINVDDFPFLAEFEESIVHFLVWFDVECLIILCHLRAMTLTKFLGLLYGSPCVLAPKLFSLTC